MTGPALEAPDGQASAGPIRVLFVCTGNSVRSVLAEAVLRERGGPSYEVFSAGTFPSGIHPLTMRVLADAGLRTDGLHSKGVEEFLDQSFDYVITMCDDARLVCPSFPGDHASLHWGYEDPSAVEGPEAARLDAFRHTLTAIGERTKQFVTVTRRARSS